MTAHMASPRRVRRASIRLRLVVGVAVILLGSLAAAEAYGLAASTEASGTRVWTDGGGTPMFSVSNLTPTQTVSRCISVFHSGVAYPGELRLSVSASGTLARHLEVVVESGAGGRFGQCDGFVGRARYTGTLQAFAATHGAHTEGLAVPTAGKSATTFRLTVTVRPDPEAAGISGNASFIWRAGNAAVSAPVLPPGEAPASPPPPGPAASAPSVESRQPGGGVSAKPHRPPVAPHEDALAEAGRPDLGPDLVDAVVVAPRNRDLGPAGSGSPAVTGPRPARPVDDGGIAADGGGANLGWRARMSKLLADAAAVIAVVVESATFPLLLLLLVLLFLLLQDRIDRNDPKLADAPIGAEPDLEFRPPLTLEGSLR